MKTIVEKKVVMKQYLPSESFMNNNLNEKMMEKTTTIYFLGLPIFRSTLNFEDSNIGNASCNKTSNILGELHP